MLDDKLIEKIANAWIKDNVMLILPRHIFPFYIHVLDYLEIIEFCGDNEKSRVEILKPLVKKYIEVHGVAKALGESSRCLIKEE